MEIYEYVAYADGKPRTILYVMADENSPSKIILSASLEEEFGREIRKYLKDQNLQKVMGVKNMQGEELSLPSKYIDSFGLRRGLSTAQLEKVLIAASTGN